MEGERRKTKCVLRFHGKTWREVTLIASGSCDNCGFHFLVKIPAILGEADTHKQEDTTTTTRGRRRKKKEGWGNGERTGSIDGRRSSRIDGWGL